MPVGLNFEGKGKPVHLRYGKGGRKEWRHFFPKNEGMDCFFLDKKGGREGGRDS